jgi:hypothetical protein
MLFPNEWGSTNSPVVGAFMLLSAYLDESDSVLKKLWYFSQKALNGDGLLPSMLGPTGEVLTPQDASDIGADLDIAMALDRAAIRWPNSAVDWDGWAQFYMMNIQRRWLDSIALPAESPGHYALWKFRSSYMRRFLYRTGSAAWTASMGAMVALLGKLPVNYIFPAPLVNANGAPATEGMGDYWAGEVTMSVPQYAHTALVFNENRTKSFAAKVNSFFVAAGADGSISKIQQSYNCAGDTVIATGLSPFTIGAAGIAAMVAGNQSIADAAWNFCSAYTDSFEAFSGLGMRLEYLLIMSGAFDAADTLRGVYPPAISSFATAGGAAVFDEGANVTMQVTVQTGGAPLRTIEFYVGDTLKIGEALGVAGQSQYAFTWNNVSKGSYTVYARARDAKIRTAAPARISFFVGKPLEIIPFTGSPFPIPGTILAVNFDNGGEGIAYHDATPGNNGGMYRQDVNVDIENTDSTLTGDTVYSIGWTQSQAEPEWVAYTISVTAADTYNIVLGYATWDTTRRLLIELDGFRAHDL